VTDGRQLTTRSGFTCMGMDLISTLNFVCLGCNAAIPNAVASDFSDRSSNSSSSSSFQHDVVTANHQSSSHNQGKLKQCSGASIPPTTKALFPQLPPFPLPSPFPLSPPFPSSSPLVPPTLHSPRPRSGNQLGSLGERCKLPQ